MSGKRNRTYSDEERQIALIFYERIRHKDNAVAEAAKLSNVEENALRFWIGGGQAGVTSLDPLEPAEAESVFTPAEADALQDDCPEPSELVADPLRYPEAFADAKDLRQWVHRHFIDEKGVVVNEDHWHLRDALIAFEWTNVENARLMKGIAATASIPGGSGGGKWDKAREEFRLRKAWGDMPDFRITIDAVIWSRIDLPVRCQLIDHELYHCSQKVDPLTGAPKFSLGKPVYALRGHDFEGFVGAYRRWGFGEAGVADLIKAHEEVQRRGRGLITPEQMQSLCGSCR